MVKSYFPKTYRQALEILAKSNPAIIAGGTDLMVKKRRWSGLSPGFSEDMIFISQLRELDYIRRENGKIYIGANVTLEKLLHDKDIPEILKKAVASMASPGVRHTATLAGNIANASPAGDTLPVLYILNARIVIGSLERENVIQIEDFILGPGSIDLRRSEIIKEIIIDDTDFDFMMYEKVGGRKSDAISKVSFAAAVSSVFDMVTDMRIAIGAVAPTVVRIREFELQLIDTPVNEMAQISGLVKDLYKPLIKPISDQRSTADYRKMCVLNFIEEFLNKAGKRIGKEKDIDW